MLTLAEAGRPEEVLVLWRQLVCVQGLGGVDIKPETYVLTLKSAAKLRAWEEVETILGMMEVRGGRCGLRRSCNGIGNGLLACDKAMV